MRLLRQIRSFLPADAELDAGGAGDSFLDQFGFMEDAGGGYGLTTMEVLCVVMTRRFMKRSVEARITTLQMEESIEAIRADQHCSNAVTEEMSTFHQLDLSQTQYEDLHNLMVDLVFDADSLNENHALHDEVEKRHEVPKVRPGHDNQSSRSHTKCTPSNKISHST
jgi:hypothetical protein